MTLFDILSASSRQTAERYSEGPRTSTRCAKKLFLQLVVWKIMIRGIYGPDSSMSRNMVVSIGEDSKECSGSNMEVELVQMAIFERGGHNR